jgi:3-hydroxyacyl-[acyl-carrier-protein] dehydratase
MAANRSVVEEGALLMKQLELSSEEKLRQVLSLIPQAEPFRFVDHIFEIDRDHVAGQYTFKVDEWFYRGHFPGNAVTPGVILLETMAQIGIVSLALYRLLEDGKDPSQFVTYFQDAQVEFLHPVYPGDTVTVKSRCLVWRRGKIKAQVDLFLGDVLAASGILAGMGVRANDAEN